MPGLPLHAAVVGPVVEWKQQMQATLGLSSHRPVITIYYLLAIVLAPLVAVALCSKTSQLWAALSVIRVRIADVSVLVQDSVTGKPVLGDAIDIDVAPRDRSSATVRYRATSAAASNKLFQAANFDLRHAGRWEFAVNVQGPQDSARIHFEVEVGEPLPSWQALWSWFCWPFVVIAIFTANQFRHSSARLRARIAVNRK